MISFTGRMPVARPCAMAILAMLDSRAGRRYSSGQDARATSACGMAILAMRD